MFLGAPGAGQAMNQSRVIVAEVDECAHTFRGEHPFQPLIHLQVAIGAADPGKQDDFAAHRSDDLLRREKNASAVSALWQPRMATEPTFISEQHGGGPVFAGAWAGLAGNTRFSAGRACGAIRGNGASRRRGWLRKGRFRNPVRKDSRKLMRMEVIAQPP